MNKKKNYLVFGFSVFLFGIISAIAAGLCCTLQFVMKRTVDSYVGSIFSGNVIEFNYVMYFLGLGFFVLTVSILYFFIVRKRFEKLTSFSISLGIIISLIYLLCAALMYFVIVLAVFMQLGLGDTLLNVFSIQVTYSWPFVFALYYIINLWIKGREIMRRLPIEPNERVEF